MVPHIAECERCSQQHPHSPSLPTLCGERNAKIGLNQLSNQAIALGNRGAVICSRATPHLFQDAARPRVSGRGSFQDEKAVQGQEIWRNTPSSLVYSNAQKGPQEYETSLTRGRGRRKLYQAQIVSGSPGLRSELLQKIRHSLVQHLVA